jgi:Dolichyl-phosphate-mannose-protein mannosyltransferase
MLLSSKAIPVILENSKGNSTYLRLLGLPAFNLRPDMQTSGKETAPAPGSPQGQGPQNPRAAGSFLAAAILAAFYLATSIYIASHRVFWFDELFTIHIARLPDVRTIWTALSHGADSLPPTYYMLVRVFGDLFGNSEVAARLPSALALAAGLLLIFDCARRLTDGLHGLIALSVATCSFLPYYGYEARSYALYFMLSALALWVWFCTRDDKKWSAIFFGLVLCLGVTMHYYFVLCLAPFLIWEILRGKRGQLASPKLIAGVVGAIVPAALLSPVILSFSHKFATGFWNRPSLGELRAIFPQLFPDGLFLLVLIVIWVVLADSDKKNVALQPMQPGEAVGWLFLCIPLIGFLLAEWKTNAFFSRYFMGVLPGVAIAFSCWTWRHFRHAAMVSVGIFLLLTGWGVATQMTVVRHPESIEATGIRPYLELEGALATEGKRYIVFSNPLLFLEAQYYSNHPERCFLLLPPDFTPQVGPRRTTPDPYLHQRLELNLSQYYPMQFWRIDDLRNHAAEAALIEPPPDILSQVKQAGFTVEMRFSMPPTVVYLH